MPICTECGKLFKNKSNLNRHARIMHPGDRLQVCALSWQQGENNLLLSEVKCSHLSVLSDFLDQPPPEDYHQLAEMYAFSTDEIEQLSMRGHRPTEMLIRGLNTRQPNLKMKDFENKCAEMNREDVVKYILEKIYHD